MLRNTLGVILGFKKQIGYTYIGLLVSLAVTFGL